MSVDNFTFSDWFVTPTKNLLEKDGIEVRLEPKVMQLLVCIARADGELVSRDELMDEIWPRAVVGDVLNNTIANLRRALGDTTPPRRFVETIPKQGYRLIPPVIWHSATPGEAESTTANNLIEPTEDKKPSFIRANRFALLFIVALGLISIIFFQSGAPTTTEPDLGASTALKTLAVLPFNTFSDQSDLKYFTGGLVEELIHQLAANPEFRVIARTSSETFKDSNSDIKEISSILGARYIVEGSVRQSGETLRVTVQLNDAENGFHIWSRTFDHQQDDNLLDTQIAIGKEVTRLISTNKTASKVYQNRKHSSSDKAYKLFLIGQSHLKFIEVPHLEKALEYFQRSVEIAPDYAVAYTGIAAARLLLHQYGNTSLAETTRLTSEALEIALSIEPELAEAYAVRGLQETYALEFTAAEEDFKYAIELNPGLRFARHNYGFMLWSLARPAEALAQFEIALEMDPLSAITNFAVGDVLGNLAEFEAAIAHYLQCQELLPELYSCYLGLASIYKITGDFEQYAYFLNQASLRIEEDNFWLTIANALNELGNGNLKQSRELMTRASAQNPSNGYFLRSVFMLDLRTSALADYSHNIKSLIIENPNHTDLNLLLGMSSFFESNCNLAVSQYEQAIKENENVMFEVWDFSNGISHYLNLAYCYQQLNRPEHTQTALLKYREFIQTLPETARNIPGVVYNEARYLMLTGKPDAASALLKQIQDWPYMWLSDFDPVL